MNVYLAARYSRQRELRDYALDLADADCSVTSRWLDGGHDVQESGQRSGYEECARFAAEDYEDLSNADTVISFTEAPSSPHSRGGRHVEFGVALALGKRCIVVGYRENVFHCLPEVEFYPSWDEALLTLASENGVALGRTITSAHLPEAALAAS